MRVLVVVFLLLVVGGLMAPGVVAGSTSSRVAVIVAWSGDYVVHVNGGEYRLSGSPMSPGRLSLDAPVDVEVYVVGTNGEYKAVLDNASTVYRGDKGFRLKLLPGQVLALYRAEKIVLDPSRPVLIEAWNHINCCLCIAGC